MKKKTAMLLILILAVVGVGGYAYYSSVQREKARIELEAKKALVAEWANKVYPGVVIDGVDFSGLTLEEAKTKFESEILDVIEGKTVKVDVLDKEYSFTYDKLNIKVDEESILEEAMDFGKDLEFEDQVAYLKAPEGTEIKVEFSHDAAYVDEFVTGIITENTQEAKDATLSRKDGAFIVTESLNGQALDAEKLKADVIAAIEPGLEDPAEIVAEVAVTEPAVKAETLRKINGVLASYTTDYSSSIANRKFNVALAAKKISGTLLMPGEVISYNKSIGSISVAAGFKEAGIFVGNKVESGIGGGVCQISSTLYQAGVRAGLGVVERRNHSMKVSYLPVGFDATVYAPYTDLKLQNNYNSPIYITSYGDGKKANVTVYGNVDEMGGKSYNFVTDVYAVLNPKTEYIDDPTLEVGTNVVEQNAVTGYKVKVYLQTIIGGKVVSTDMISSDSYKVVNKIVRRGTKPAPVVTPVETPEEPQPTEAPVTP